MKLRRGASWTARRDLDLGLVVAEELTLTWEGEDWVDIYGVE